MDNQHVVLSGCSGGGKSTLLAELERRGFAVVPEPGRRIVEEQMRSNGDALPWADSAAFANLALSLAGEDRKKMSGEQGWMFFDRGLIDAAVALEHATGTSARETLKPFAPYHGRVFMTPPWPEIYVTDSERLHSLSDAIEEYDRLMIAFGELGYETFVLPKTSVDERADFVLDCLEPPDGAGTKS